MSIAPNHIPGADWSRYSNPFLTPSSDGFPTRLETALDLAEFLFFFHPEYASATARLVSHFCTGLDWKGQVGGVGEREELANLLFDKLDLRGHMRQLGMNWGCFGNGMAVVHQPFDRFLIDTRGARLKTWDLSMFQDLEGVQYNWDKMTYTVPDPLKMRQESHKLHTAGNAVPTVEFEIYDQASRDVSRLAIRQLDPRTLVLDEAISGKLVVYDRFSVDFRQQIKSNQLHQISQTPIAILREQVIR